MCLIICFQWVLLQVLTANRRLLLYVARSIPGILLHSDIRINKKCSLFEQCGSMIYGVYILHYLLLYLVCIRNMAEILVLTKEESILNTNIYIGLFPESREIVGG